MQRLNKCLKIAEELNDEVEAIEGLDTLIYFTVETHGGYDCRIIFLNQSVWDSKDNNIENDSETIKSEIKEELKSWFKVLNGLLTQTQSP